MNEQIFTVMEFSGRGDAMFGGSAADCSLYCQSARKDDPASASNIDPLVVRDGERPTGWSWSGLRSPVGRVGETFRL